MSDLSSDEVEQCKSETLALISAWMDRGFSPSESAAILAATAHQVLAEMKVVSLEDFIAVITAGWKAHNGKL